MVGTIKSYPLEGIYDFFAIDLSSNQFEGLVPLFFYKFESAYLSNNKFSSLNSSCDVKDDTLLSFLDISYNRLAGEFPDCWSHFPRLEILILNNNKLSGKLPTSIGSLPWIKILHFGSNSLIGNLPSSLKKCKELTILYLGENRLQGSIPSWMGVLSNLVILSLRSNQFNGSIPSSLCEMASIQILDMSLNYIYGDIPNCVGNFTAMKQRVRIKRYVTEYFLDYAPPTDTSITLPYNGSIHGYGAQVELIWKGRLSQYQNTLGLVKSIDLSSNKLTGEIPKEITQLIELVSLNLSRNDLSGEIPRQIGHLKSLDALDLSRNNFFGEIPLSLSQVDRLNVLDLSRNNLSGKIPTATQLQSFSSSSYMGNPQLCGLPLFKCPDNINSTTFNEIEDEYSFINRGFYASMGLGFVVGFWGLCGTLVFIKSWRYAYFKLLNCMGDWIYVMVGLQKEKILRMIKS
ncbi:receptor-like protein EIX2 [Humulus lupulus]|uniref:receptor-like protein EIX2 n=1 Tax=Humulus lupulus TaxID=3486 RepID=UPI002B4127ED|nr:receptor-like protein EIX2 [Humulus lupulus]